MNDLALLSGLYFTQFKNKLSNPTKEGLIKGFLIFIFAAFFFPAVYQLFYFMFKHFFSVPLVGPLLVNKLLSAFFMTFSVMVILSSVVSAIPVLYLSRDMDFLFSAPVAAENVFAAQAARVIYGASWMIILMGVPIFAAYGRVLKITVMQYLFILLAHVPFCVILACAGITLTMLLVRYFPAENVRNIAVAVLGIFAAIMIVYFRMLQPEKLTAASIDQVSDFLRNLKTPDSIFLPHTHFMEIVRETTANGVYAGLAPFLYLASAGLAVAAATMLAAKLLYFDGYGKKGAYKKEKPLGAGYVYGRQPAFISQMQKDTRYMLRDTSQWIQVVFLFGLVFIYLFNLYKLPADLFGLKDFIYFLNIAFIGLILSAVGSRFILPVISNEGRSFWVYRTAPMGMARYVLFKLLIYGAPVILTGQVVAFVSIKVLKSNEFISWITLYSTFFITLVIASAGIGFGAYFAKFDIKNPEELVTGAAGLAYMFVSFIFVALTLFIEAGVIREYFLAKLVKMRVFVPEAFFINYALVALASVLVSAGTLWIGILKLKNMEL
jgi:ABC-2 type transport system permease protein